VTLSTFSISHPAKASLTVQISAGELPIEAAKLEGQLSRIFKTTNHWSAILLLDEADVFLERRSPNNLTRNGLVSVFLRKLEYCQGIMFLTTNRVSQFDDAILSRTHLVLRYDDLNNDARKQAWGNFLSRAITSSGEAKVTDEELGQLASNKFNGRQVSYITEYLAFVLLTEIPLFRSRISCPRLTLLRLRRGTRLPRARAGHQILWPAEVYILEILVPKIQPLRLREAACARNLYHKVRHIRRCQ
jgi:hypothetical protein